MDFKWAWSTDGPVVRRAKIDRRRMPKTDSFPTCTPNRPSPVWTNGGYPSLITATSFRRNIDVGFRKKKFQSLRRKKNLPRKKAFRRNDLESKTSLTEFQKENYKKVQTFQFNHQNFSLHSLILLNFLPPLKKNLD